MDKRRLLKLALYSFTLFSIGSLYFSFETGYLHFLWNADSSKLTFVILSIFIYAFIKLGKMLHSHKSVTDTDIDLGYELCDISMGLGMLGTVIGFIMMTTAFAGIDISNVDNIKQLFSISTQGMSTALYTTAAGLMSSLSIRVSYYLTQRWLS